jgi:glycopeptide antibiotics resistance protein
VHKQLFLWAAVVWAGIIAFFCLVQLNNVPLGNVSNIDKYVHGFFHFVLTSLCYLFLKNQMSSLNSIKPLVFSFLFSFFFGIVIEISQELFTISRHADIYDVSANTSGAVLAVAIAVLFKKYK